MTALLVLGLLASASISAPPPQTWTLWAHGTHPSGVEEWQRVESAASQADCWAIFPRLQLMDVDAGVMRTVVEGHRTTAYYRDGTKYVVDFTCLPNSVDPRR